MAKGEIILIYLWGTIFGVLFILCVYEAVRRAKNANPVKATKKAK